jgi:hypothetical protein
MRTQRRSIDRCSDASRAISGATFLRLTICRSFLLTLRRRLLYECHRHAPGRRLGRERTIYRLLRNGLFEPRITAAPNGCGTPVRPRPSPRICARSGGSPRSGCSTTARRMSWTGRVLSGAGDLRGVSVWRCAGARAGSPRVRLRARRDPWPEPASANRIAHAVGAGAPEARSSRGSAAEGRVRIW